VSSFSSKLRFTGDQDFYVSEESVAASFGRRFGDVLSLRLVLGAVLDGEFERPQEHYDVRPGFLVAANVARRWFGGSGYDWFLTTSLTVGVSFAGTTSPSGAKEALTAQDSRIAVLLGHSFAKRWNPYIAARVFGGPVFWTLNGEKVTGSDRHHYAIGLGGSYSVGGGVDLMAEGAFFGEKSLSAGASISF
jgi:hypothetical protein